MARGARALNMTLLDFLNASRGREQDGTSSEERRKGGGSALDEALTTVRGKPITVGDVLVYLKATGAFRNAIYQMIAIEVVSARAQELGILLTEQELHEYCKAKRKSMGLVDAVAMNRYCRWLGITFAHWQKQAEIELLRRRLQEALFPEAKIRQVYEERRADLKTLTLSRIVRREKAEIEALLQRLQAGEADFSTLARNESLERNTGSAGGYLGRLRRGMLPEDIERALFAAAPNSLVGPLQQDGYWVLYRVDDVQDCQYTEELREQIGERLFREWLEQEVRNAPA